MSKLGLDYGTTYSVITRLKNVETDEEGIPVSYELEACLPSEKAVSPQQDSVAVRRREGTFVFGTSTRREIGRKGAAIYKGFKMMLAEKDEEVLKARGYDQENTPQQITAKFLNYILRQQVSRDGQIDKLVVGVPEIWFSDTSTIDSRTTLESIIADFPYVGQVELVSEPACACAFFADNYKRNKGEEFQGKILIVDYGGGTLDLALCDVHGRGTRSEVSVLKRCGAGLNEEGFIGKAGMAFIEKVVRLALMPLGLDDDKLMQMPYFYTCIDEVENQLMERTAEIEEMFGIFDASDREEAADLFYSIDIDEEDKVFPVTYGMLAKAYNEVIKPVLDDKLDEMIAYMNEHGINYMDIKIAPVGGFCNFCLTHKQIEDKLKKYDGDLRFADIITDPRECERAIAYGAALIANDVIGFKQTSPYHLGIAGGYEGNIYWAIHKGDDLVENKPFFIHYEDEEETEVPFAGEKIPAFAICLSDTCNGDETGWAEGELLKEYKDKLLLEANKVYKFGFSLDRSMIITLHKRVVDINDTDRVLEESSVRLNNVYAMFGGMFGLRRVKK